MIETARIDCPHCKDEVIIFIESSNKKEGIVVGVGLGIDI